MSDNHVLARLDVPCDEHAPGEVRASLADLPEIGQAADDLSLVASELVTNAVLHSGCSGRDRLRVLVERGDRNLIVSVRDPGRSGGAARLAGARPPGDGGLGLRIVEMLAERWGQSRGDGYRVWAELPLTAAH